MPIDGVGYVVEAVPNTKAKTVYIVSAYMSNNAGDAQLANAKPDVNVQNVDVASPAGSTVPQASPVVNPDAAIPSGGVTPGGTGAAAAVITTRTQTANSI